MARHQVTSFELLGMGGAVTRSLSGTAANERLSPYANAIETHRIRIFEVYLRYEEKKPVMLFLPRRGQVPGDTFWYLRSREK